MHVVFKCSANEPTITYDFASMQIDTIKNILGNLTDESLLGLHGDAFAMHIEQSKSDSVQDTAELLEDTLNTLPYLDVDRALSVYDRAISNEGVHTGTRQFVPFGMKYLTEVAGDRSLPIWHKLFSDEMQMREYSKLVAEMILSHRAIYVALSADGFADLQRLSEES
jgi:hypothetical protein